MPHRCINKNCPFNAPEGEDYCDLCRSFKQVFNDIEDNTQRLRTTRQSLGLAFTPTLASSRLPVRK